MSSIKPADAVVSNNCTICTELLNDPKTLPCSHKFHPSCIEKWLNTQSQSHGGSNDAKCPLCTRVIIPQQNPERSLSLARTILPQQSQARPHRPQPINIPALVEVVQGMPLSIAPSLSQEQIDRLHSLFAQPNNEIIGVINRLNGAYEMVTVPVFINAMQSVSSGSSCHSYTIFFVPSLENERQALQTQDPVHLRIELAASKAPSVDEVD